ncbi:unnamed protein product [Urochloa humidicola]
MDHHGLALPSPPPPPPQSPPVAAASAPSSPYSVLHPFLLPSPNPHLLLKPKTLTHSLSSSSLTSVASSSPLAPAADAWEVVTPIAPLIAHVDGGIDDCAIFPPRLHEGLGLDGEPEEAAAAKEAEEEEEEEGLKNEEELTTRLGGEARLGGWGRGRPGPGARARRVRVLGGEARRVVGCGSGRRGGGASVRPAAG